MARQAPDIKITGVMVPLKVEEVAEVQTETETLLVDRMELQDQPELVDQVVAVVVVVSGQVLMYVTAAAEVALEQMVVATEAQVRQEEAERLGGHGVMGTDLQ